MQLTTISASTDERQHDGRDVRENVFHLNKLTFQELVQNV